MRIQLDFRVIAAIGVLIPWFSTQPAVGHFLVNSRNSTRLFLIASGMAAIGLILGLLGMSDVMTAIAFAIPAFQIFIVRIGYYLFFRIMDRYPKNVIFNWEEGLGLDRFFLIVLVLLGCVLPLAIARSI